MEIIKLKIILVVIIVMFLCLTLIFAMDANVPREKISFVKIKFIDSVKEYDFSSIKSITYKKQTTANHIVSLSKGQSAFNIGDTVFSVKKKGLTNSIILDSSFSTSFKFENMEKTNPHSNTVDVMDWEGQHYVYISEWDGLHRCFVERLWFNPTTKKWLTMLVQTLSLDIPDSIRGDGNMDWIIDKENGLVYTQTYKNGSSRTAKSLVFMQFKLPNPSSGDAVLRVNDILKIDERPAIYVTQDKKIHKNQLFIVSGGPESYYKRKITVFNLPELTLARETDLSLFNEEPEGLFFYRDKLMMLYKEGVFEISEKPMFFLRFNDTNSVSYALEDIKSIEFK